jgi:hypothetical protein
VILSDKQELGVENDAILEAGTIGVVAKADSATYFDELTAASLDPR